MRVHFSIFEILLGQCSHHLIYKLSRAFGHDLLLKHGSEWPGPSGALSAFSRSIADGPCLGI